MDAASAELTPQYERFEGLDEGVAKRDPGAWPLRMREVAEALAARGFERRAVERMGDDFVQFVRESAYGCDRVLVERTGEWAWRNQDGTVAGSDLRELQNIIQQEI